MGLKIKTLIVDDSRLVRRAVRDMLRGVGEDLVFLDDAENGRVALERIMRLRPDLVILDVEMPEMDGITLLKELKRRKIHPAILMLSVLTRHGASTTFEALELGALDFVPKPAAGSDLTLQDIEGLLLARVMGLMETIRDLVDLNPKPLHVAPDKKRYDMTDYRILVIGSSTGGPQALQQVFRSICSDFPVPILVVQHMPPFFTRAFAERLDQICPLRIVEAEEGMNAIAGSVFVAPGNKHMLLKKEGENLIIRLSDAPPRHAHRPSIDATLESVKEALGGRAAAIIMTGMGWDGAQGMKDIYGEGGYTLAQDEDSSVVFGMNRRAIELGGVVKVLSLAEIAPALNGFFRCGMVDR